MQKLVISNLTKSFHAKAGDTLVLDDVSLHVDDGELVCLVGASGCGKSTLLSMVAGLEPATSGSMALDGETIVGPGPDRGLVFQGYSLYPWRTVAENVAFGLEVNGVRRYERRDRIDYYLKVMGLLEWRDAYPRQLSGGMRQRVAIARALATEPEMLLLDEPFGALDAQNKSLMQEFMLHIWQETGTTILMVTHDVEEAIYLSQRIYVMSSRPGRIKREIAVPFDVDRDTHIRRDSRFLDLREEIHHSLMAELVV